MGTSRLRKGVHEKYGVCGDLDNAAVRRPVDRATGHTAHNASRGSRGDSPRYAATPGSARVSTPPAASPGVRGADSALHEARERFRRLTGVSPPQSATPPPPPDSPATPHSTQSVRARSKGMLGTIGIATPPRGSYYETHAGSPTI